MGGDYSLTRCRFQEQLSVGFGIWIDQVTRFGFGFDGLFLGVFYCSRESRTLSRSILNSDGAHLRVVCMDVGSQLFAYCH